MDKLRICLSIGKMDSAFEKMIADLSPYAEVVTVGLTDYSLAGFDLFIGKKLPVKILETADKLKAVFAYKTGVDAFPLTHLAHKGIRVFNSHADSKIIAEYAFGLAISLVNRVSEFDRNLRQGIWYDTKNEFWQSLFSMKVGLLGYGHIGKDVHKILKNNGIATYTLNRGKTYENIGLASSLDELIEICDLLILSLPQTAETNDMFNDKNLAKMQGKYLVNVGRANAINQKALFNALKHGTLAGAAIDTWDEKPKTKKTLLKPSEYDFETLTNIILSPHAAMRVANGHQNYVEDVTQNVIRYITGETPINEIDLKAGY
jgi:phosphoglycerate dehydrogenase-like enzyme